MKTRDNCPTLKNASGSKNKVQEFVHIVGRWTWKSTVWRLTIVRSMSQQPSIKLCSIY